MGVLRKRSAVWVMLSLAGAALCFASLLNASSPVSGAGPYTLVVPGLAADDAVLASPTPTGTTTAVPTPSNTPSPSPTPVATVTPTLTPIPPGNDLTMPIHAFRVADDDGSRQAHVTAEQVLAWVAFTNQVYAPAGIVFSFDSATDFEDIQSTLLNTMTGVDHPQWEQQRQAANALQAQHPGSFAVFFRWGPDPAPTGGGFGWYDYNFIAMGGWDDMGHCGHRHWEALGHELGHFLGLPHTFAFEPFLDLAAAESTFIANGKDPTIFDGDGLSDTAPDPGTRTLECPHTNPIVLAGTTFNLPRTNIMSYYDEASVLTAQQVARVRWVFGLREEGAGGFRRNAPTSPREAESFTASSIAATDGSYSVQEMAPWGPERFSGGEQIFWAPDPGSGRITFRFVVTTVATYQLAMFATLAPDFGQFSVSIDNVPTGAIIDGYAPLVVPSGRISLGSVSLAPGLHEITFDSVGKNGRSTGHAFGFDAFEILSRVQ
ncbi:MAG: hypothetical protein IT303_04075 [Dehalococcoidia bacterium]|nr:hypothetical protein [Dehalococcoidia bacterium]